MTLLVATPLMALTVDDAQQLLRDVDSRIVGDRAPHDMKADMRMTIVDKNGNQKVRTLKTWARNLPDRNDDWRLLKFVSPPDMRNVGFLVLADDQLYLYLPEFRRVRRIASHAKRESFMGSDFSYEDLATSGFAPYYNPKLLEDTDRFWILELTRKPDADRAYSRIKMWVDKSNTMPVKLELYDDQGNLWKVTEQTFTKIKDYWVATRILMKDVKKGSHTVLDFKNIEVDTHIPDRVFTQRYLRRRVKS